MNSAVADRQRFLDAVATMMGPGGVLLGRPGTAVVPDPDRSHRRVACYRFMDGQSVLWCDPELENELAPMADPATSLTEDDFHAWGAERGAEVLGRSLMKTLGDPSTIEAQAASPVGDGLSLRRLDWGDEADRAAMQVFIDACPDDDLEEAEVAMDDLDDLALAVTMHHNGSDLIVSYASARPSDFDPEFGDIGVVGRPDMRRSGLGRRVVAGLCADLLPSAGMRPLYRCDPDNIGSDRLSDALGFETVVSLSVIQLPS